MYESRQHVAVHSGVTCESDVQNTYERRHQETHLWQSFIESMPNSVRIFMFGGVVLGGTLVWAKIHDKGTSPPVFQDYCKFVLSCYAFTLPVPLLQTSVSRSEALMMHAGLVSIAAPLQVGAYVVFRALADLSKK